MFLFFTRAARGPLTVALGLMIMMTPSMAQGEAAGLMIGVGRSVINPFLDVPMAGYYYTRSADGVHDDLYAKAVIFDDGRDQIVLVACDVVEIPRAVVEQARERITQQLKIPASHVLISATHSHTGPVMVEEYCVNLSHWIADSVMTARSLRPLPQFSWLDSIQTMKIIVNSRLCRDCGVNSAGKDN